VDPLLPVQEGNSLTADEESGLESAFKRELVAELRRSTSSDRKQAIRMRSSRSTGRS
jgi:hypothetical protein